MGKVPHFQRVHTRVSVAHTGMDAPGEESRARDERRKVKVSRNLQSVVVRKVSSVQSSVARKARRENKSTTDTNYLRSSPKPCECPARRGRVNRRVMGQIFKIFPNVTPLGHTVFAPMYLQFDSNSRRRLRPI